MIKDSRTIEEKIDRLSKLGVEVSLVTEVNEDTFKDSRVILGKMNVEGSSEEDKTKKDL